MLSCGDVVSDSMGRRLQHEADMLRFWHAANLHMPQLFVAASAGTGMYAMLAQRASTHAH